MRPSAWLGIALASSGCVAAAPKLITCPVGQVLISTGSDWACGVNGSAPAGPTGSTGTAGALGFTGETGAVGPTGAMGVPGLTGPNGSTGSTGSFGAQGLMGATGSTGLVGATGSAGATGTAGLTWIGPWDATGTTQYVPGDVVSSDGSSWVCVEPIRGGAAPSAQSSSWALLAEAGSAAAMGATGSTGAPGLTGPTGVGFLGPTGVTGDQGSTGSEGTTGPTGIQGSTGSTGSTGVGVQGPTGATGAAGSTGGIGPSGVTGSTGATGATIPPGTVIAYAAAVGGGTQPPTGWLLCDGSSVLQSAYPDLFAVLGTTYGSADAAHFNVPDYRGYFLRGLDQGAGVDPNAATRTAPLGGSAGDAIGTTEAGAYAAHTHGVTDPGHSHSLPSVTGYGGSTSSPLIYGENEFGTYVSATNSSTTGISIQSSGGAETRPINTAVNYLIKF